MTGSLTEQQAKEVLKRNTIGRIGCFDGKEVYIIPVFYLYDGHIISHARVGKKIKVMRKQPNVCFEVDQINSSKNWKSVIALGTYEEITDKTEKWNAMQEFLKKKLYIKKGETSPIDEISGTPVHQKTTSPIIYKIVIRKITGRYEVEDREELL